MPSVPEKPLRPILTRARLEAALRVAARSFGVRPAAIARRGRQRSPVAARFAVWAALYDETRATLSQIAAMTGGSVQYDHSTIRHGIRAARAWEARGDAEAARGLAAVRAAVREAREAAPVEREAA